MRPGDIDAPTGVWSWVPGLRVLRDYDRAWLRHDLVAAIVLSALLIPQGMAYAELAGLPAVTGLYTTVTSLVGYAVFGPSRVLVLGPDSALAPVIAAIIAPLVLGDSPAEAVALAGMLAVFAGLIEMAAGALRLGSMTDLLSMPVRVGYLNGIALLVLASQLPKLFGFSIGADSFIGSVDGFVSGVRDGDAVMASLLVGLGSMVVILGGRRYNRRVPWVLLAAVGAIAISTILGLSGEGVSVVGALPSGFPQPALPSVAWDDLDALAAGAIAITIVSVADTAALSRSFSAKRGERVDQNREAIGLGAANVLTGMFQGFPTSASSSRTVVAASVGSKTQLTGALAALLIVGLLVGGEEVLADLPSSVLAAIVIVASFGLFDLGTVLWLARVRRSGCVASVVATVGVVLVGVLEGLLIAIGVSLGIFVWKRWRPHTAVLGRVEGRKGYHDVGRHPAAYRPPGLVLFRFDAPLFFANAQFFEAQLLHAIAEHDGRVERVVIAGEAMTDIDSTGHETLVMVLDRLDADGIDFAFAELKGPVKDRLVAYGLHDRIGEQSFYPTLGTAVAAYGKAYGVPTRRRRDD